MESTVLQAGGAQRHLAAIFAADVAGYSRLVGLDEEVRFPGSRGFIANSWRRSSESTADVW